MKKELSKENKQKIQAAAAGAAGGFAAAMGVQYGDDIIDGLDVSSEDESFELTGELPAEPVEQDSDYSEAIASKVSNGAIAGDSAVPEEEVINGLAFDMNGDDIIDAVEYDINNDGQMDTVLLDIDQDGVFEYAGVDTNGDFVADSHFVDINGDQWYDLGIDENAQEQEIVSYGDEEDMDQGSDVVIGEGEDDIAIDMNNDMDISEWA
ncbi:hypothetical protein DYBT9275_02818 [Dyadobacter sp. CECT 9275]|uniref:EF-hand domain-containing protein n=1 Tax=Dyadobacter helix TaxID=2822344 RepID=A0A916JCT0_9BACT|nr:hypothetical protein [Dyadobacter sp. CECT 9275]CAG5002140.1 hypothetical protein DYBT9275_02818 [Dyadobacter sp. CECT 9275]